MQFYSVPNNSLKPLIKIGKSFTDLWLKEELGEEWLSPNFFRFGASSLLDDVLRQIRKLKTNAYQSSYYFPRG